MIAIEEESNKAWGVFDCGNEIHVHRINEIHEHNRNCPCSPILIGKDDRTQRECWSHNEYC